MAMICGWLRLCKSVENEGLGEWHAQIRPRPRCDVKNNERGQERGCNLAFPFRASFLLSFPSLSPNHPDLLELFPPSMVERRAFSKKHVTFVNFPSFFFSFPFRGEDIRAILEYFYFSSLAISWRKQRCIEFRRLEGRQFPVTSITKFPSF